MADKCGFLFRLTSRYFKAPKLSVTIKSMASVLPNGGAWAAKAISNTVIYALVVSVATVYYTIQGLYEDLSEEFNLYTALEYLGLWEKSVSLPDTRITSTVGTTCERRQAVKQRLEKKATVTLQEIQDLIDSTFPGYGIWVSAEKTGGGFRYDFRYIFEHGGGTRDRWVMDVHIPWLAIDPLDLENSPLTWDNLQSWLRDFSPCLVLFNPIYEPEASYAVITDPQNGQNIYAEPSVDGQTFVLGEQITVLGGPVSILSSETTWAARAIYWKQIDKNGTVINHLDYEVILPTTTEITRTFIDSASDLISTTIDVRVTTIL